MREEREVHAMPVALLPRMPSCHPMLHAILSYGRGSTVCKHASMARQAQVHDSTPCHIRCHHSTPCHIRRHHPRMPSLALRRHGIPA